MMDIGWSELLLIGIVALLVVGPKELPRLMRTVGYWSRRARDVAGQFRSGFDDMVRDIEIEEYRKEAAAHAMRIQPVTNQPNPATQAPVDPDAAPPTEPVPADPALAASSVSKP
jgi:sec-independent protein translocase protein TatB